LLVFFDFGVMKQLILFEDLACVKVKKEDRWLKGGNKKEDTMIERIEGARRLFLELEERSRVREEAIEDARRVFCIRERLDIIRG